VIPGHERLSAASGIQPLTSSSAPSPAQVQAAAADVVDAGGLAAHAAEVAARQRSPQTRHTYVAVLSLAAGIPLPHTPRRAMTSREESNHP